MARSPLPLDDMEAWLRAFAQPGALLELGVLALAWALAWLAVRGLQRAFNPDAERSIWFGRRGIDGVLFPLLWLVLAYAGRALTAMWVPRAVWSVAIPALIALVVIRVGVKVLEVAFRGAAWLRPVERSLSWLAWLAAVAWITGLLPVVLAELDQIHWKLGGSTVSVRTLLEGALSAAVVLIVALWVSSAIEARLLRDASGESLSLRKAASNATRALLLFVGLMLALSAVGIDLTALSVLGGAIGVGIGFGLQKLAANYVSGFVILTERSMRIGDMVRLDTFEGVVADIKARYTVIRSVSGRESIVPNEMLITQRVENLSLSDPRVWQSTVVSVAYDSDVDLVQRLLEQAALEQPRVLRDPAPLAALSAFGADGLEFTLGYWIADPENGQLGLRSAINLRILALLREHGVEIPYPQRVLHLRGAAGAGVAQATNGGAG
ncbi:MAG: mechanosensitive ion channel [Tepidimonas ignava]|uniref:Mechanosensitive channel MscK n=1 Tax=Tepidimonas ignava TaxID=114249 RepID=A0A4R3LIY0_9BURK|nr:mechanosensitive ion channel domain-containing protein [Tepidimonas ignava]MCX7814387.1 mechanosensitive ion channel [Tepidimonas ignava]TCS99495.1 mechanosensitive ion channel-like protein [Tepidimonas ignava]TSE21995.1 Mechanosensitive channel MscK [Tepidimonas ignava]